MTQNKNSVLNPVGKAQAILVGETMMSMVLCDQSLVPVGTELFVQPSEGRLKLEIKVANDNALKWQNALDVQQERNKQLRDKLIKALAFLQRAESLLPCSPLRRDVYKFLQEE